VPGQDFGRRFFQQYGFFQGPDSPKTPIDAVFKPAGRDISLTSQDFITIRHHFNPTRQAERTTMQDLAGEKTKKSRAENADEETF
jgi:hypothetical protein